jgi:ubiquinone/menaquinone biosynthesis C-methylase UbiE
MSDIDGLRSLYAHTAPLYEQCVIPAFGPLADDLARWIVYCASAWLHYELADPFDPDLTDAFNTQLLRSMTALDLGTGTGILARALATTAGRVIGVDLSPAMLRVATRQAHGSHLNVHFVAADLHRLPVRRGAAQLIVSSFGLNASTPKLALRSVAKALRPGHGMFAFQEWGAQDDCSRIVDEVLNAYAPDEIPGMDKTLRDYYDSPKPWYDQLQYAEDYYELLKQTGFDMVWVKEAPFVTVHLPSADSFLAYKLAWPQRRLTLGAMTEEQRADFYNAARARLQPNLNPDGSLDWSPPLFRVFATR